MAAADVQEDVGGRDPAILTRGIGRPRSAQSGLAGRGWGDEEGKHDPFEEEGDPDRGDQRRQPRSVAQPAVGDPLDDHTREPGEGHGDGEDDEQGEDQAAGAGAGEVIDVEAEEPLEEALLHARDARQEHRVEGAQGEDVTMGEVDQLDDAVDQGVAHGDERVDGAQDQAAPHLVAGGGGTVPDDHEEQEYQEDGGEDGEELALAHPQAKPPPYPWRGSTAAHRGPGRCAHLPLLSVGKRGEATPPPAFSATLRLLQLETVSVET